MDGDLDEFITEELKTFNVKTNDFKTSKYFHFT